MNVFLRFLINNKKYLLISLFFMIISGFIFGLFIYENSYPFIKNTFQYLFYFNHDDYNNHYNYYMIINCLFILISTYLSSSFVGFLGHYFLCFIKAIQISYSMIYIMSFELSFVLWVIVLIELIGEIVFIVCICYMGMNFSLYNFMLTFYVEENFDIKYTLNYVLNIILISVFILFLLLVFRIYFVSLL